MLSFNLANNIMKLILQKHQGNTAKTQQYALVLVFRLKSQGRQKYRKNLGLQFWQAPLNQSSSPLQSSKTQCTTQSPCTPTKLVHYKHIPLPTATLSPLSLATSICSNIISEVCYVCHSESSLQYRRRAHCPQIYVAGIWRLKFWCQHCQVIVPLIVNFNYN